MEAMGRPSPFRCSAHGYRLVLDVLLVPLRGGALRVVRYFRCPVDGCRYKRACKWDSPARRRNREPREPFPKMADSAQRRMVGAGAIKP